MIPNQPLLRNGQTLGRYEIRERLGAGGMGEVYRAYDHNLKREVAIKVFYLGSADPMIRARFIREAETAGGLEHSHIVSVYDYGVERDINYIVMRNLTGGSLSERMKQAAELGRQRASLTEVALLLEHLASALDYAHAQGVIHRDVKPQNVMFDNQGQAFLVDFGIAKLLSGATNMTGTGMSMGTPVYMAPEQVAGKDVVAATDQYALAVMTYQMIAGRLPFEADTPLQVMYKHVHEQPTPISAFRTDVPAGLLLVMDRAMAKDPAARFPNCTQFAQAFASAVSGVPAAGTEFFTFKMARSREAGAPYTPAPSRPVTAPIVASPQPQARPSRGLLLGVVGILLVLAVLAALIFGRGDGASESDLRLTEVTSTQPGGVALVMTDTPDVVPTLTDQPPSETPTVAPSETTTLRPTETATSTPTYTPEPSATATEAASETPQETATFDLGLLARATMDAEATGTATQWTPTPTEDFPATIAMIVAATRSGELTATATLWTPTPTDTATHTPSNTPSATATDTPTFTASATATSTVTPSPTLTPDPITLARTPITRNADWTPVTQDFDGVAMMLVPAGCFNMGSTTGDADERPVHQQCFAEPYWIDQTEVTQAQFSANGGVKADPNEFIGGQRPVERITWFEANAYCQQRSARLPTEAEWEYAARGPSGLTNPWGNTFVGDNLVYGGNSNNQTANVGSRPAGASWVGAQDMAGNVWEWTSSLYEPYPYDATDGREADTGNRTDVSRVLRGGAWDFDGTDSFRAAFRGRVSPGLRSFSLGFRCARS